MSDRVPTWPRVVNGQILCPVCGADRVVSLALIDYKGEAQSPNFSQFLLGPLRCEACGWSKGETQT